MLGGTAAGEREAGVAKRGKDDMIYVGLFGEQQRKTVRQVIKSAGKKRA
jgi:hypothetical protein